MRKYTIVDMINFAKEFDPNKKPIEQIKAYNKKNPELSAKQRLLNVLKGFRQYENDVLNMSDEELYDHVFNGDYDPEDFASKEAAKRGITK